MQRCRVGESIDYEHEHRFAENEQGGDATDGGPDR